MATYAKNTTVTSEKSRAEIERTLTRYGARSFMYGWNEQSAIIAFDMNGLRIKFQLPMPDPADFLRTDVRNKLRSKDQQQLAYEKAVRQKWRALSLVIKAKLEAVESEISVFEEEFLANIVLPDGSTVGDFMVPQIRLTYESGRMPPMLMPGGE
jgi:hypothetical protein